MNYKTKIIGFLTILSSLSVNGQKLSEQQKIEDFEYMFHIFKENYPYFGVLERDHNLNWVSNKSKYLKLIKDSKDDKEFITAIKIALNDLHSGHTDFMPTFYRDYFIKAYSSQKEPKRKDYRTTNYRETWVDQLIKGDNYWSELFGVGEKSDDPVFLYDSTSLSFTIIEENKIAVLKIKSFNQIQIEADSSRIYDYLESVKNYENLIIDIQDNSGGDARYWRDNLVPFLLKDEIKFKNYLAIRKGDFIKPFFKEIDFQKEPFEISKELKELPKEVIEKDFYLVSDTNVIVPKNNVGFSGNIFLLVNKGVYSSAEGFAVFCKSTGWATVVGETTSGDGIGIDPIIFCLPNSKILIRFPSSMGLNPDGSSNEEKNTEPDLKIEGRSSEERLYNFARTINPNIEYTYYDIPPILNDCKVDVIIYPTNESSDSLNKKIFEQVKSVNELFFHIPDSLIMPDTVALKMTLKNRNINCYGSINGNLWIKGNIKHFPIEITSEYIKAREFHKGTNLSLITSWFNSESDNHYVRFYTAQNSEGVLGISNVFHGPTNYVIADDNYELIESGNYSYNRNNHKYEISK